MHPVGKLSMVARQDSSYSTACSHNQCYAVEARREVGGQGSESDTLDSHFCSLVLLCIPVDSSFEWQPVWTFEDDSEW